MKLCAACNNTFADTETFCPHDGEVLQESPQDIVGRVIDGKYQVESFIAQGGMGAVYRARHILLGDQVVIKTLRPEMRGNSEWLKRFQREGKAARAFRHPNSVTVYDLSAGTDGLIYMVMEYVEGHTLDRELKRRGRFSPQDALAVLEPVADVLDSAHGRGVVHRDLKPENIMLGGDDRGGTVVKVLDLGIAKMVGVDVHAGSATSLTVAGQLLGTPYYMSPEQWGELPRDGNPEVDGRTDIYSLGMIFFELVAGQKPLGGRTLAELRQKHVSVPMPRLETVAEGVPEEFAGWVARAMAKDRADRPQTAGEMIDGLRSSLRLPARGRGHGVRFEGVGLDAGGGRGSGSGPSATGRVSPETSADAPAHASAETIVTSDFDSDVPSADRARETSAQQRGKAGGGDASRETIVDRAADTRADSSSGASRTSARVAAGGASAAASHASSHGPVVTAPAIPETAQGPRRSFVPLVAGGLLALLLLGGFGGWLALRDTKSNVNAVGPEVPKPGATAANVAPGVAPNAPPDAPKVEAASYWFEVFEKPEDKSGARVAELAPTLTSGKSFRFHFVPKERGFLYIIIPNQGGNAQTTILTGMGGPEIETNVVGADADFVFPAPAGPPIKLDSRPGSDDATFIFSPKPLMSPDFLAKKFNRKLTPEEIAALEEFRAQFKADAPAFGVVGEGAERRVAVGVPATAQGRTLIFDIRVNHK
ncbi:MAG TPA: serine/threonine-protein kinase [Pyrinomonadaceae bacterium]|nr:serine/threonine-protein kinase [Pyrinomonadaceae bacterium]